MYHINMDQEQLIECVKTCEPLYIMNHPKYSDIGYKDSAWRTIAKEMNESVAVCKKTWTCLRDSFRRAVKRKRETKSGQAASKIKKWRFEEEMSFLLPFMQERDTNLKNISDDSDDEDEEHTDKCNDENDDRKDENRSDDKDDETIFDVVKSEGERQQKQKKINRKIITKVNRNKANNPPAEVETASAVVVKYLLQTANAQIAPSTQQNSAIDIFFSSIAATVKNFSPYYQNIAKSKIFAIANDLEMKQIRQEL